MPYLLEDHQWLQLPHYYSILVYWGEGGREGGREGGGGEVPGYFRHYKLWSIFGLQLYKCKNHYK